MRYRIINCGSSVYAQRQRSFLGFKWWSYLTEWSGNVECRPTVIDFKSVEAAKQAIDRLLEVLPAPTLIYYPMPSVPPRSNTTKVKRQLKPSSQATYTINYWPAGDLSGFSRKLPNGTQLPEALCLAMDYERQAYSVELWEAKPDCLAQCIYTYTPPEA